MNPKQPPGPPMTLGNMRELGVRGHGRGGKYRHVLSHRYVRSSQQATCVSLAHLFGRDGCDGARSSRLSAARRRGQRPAVPVLVTGIQIVCHTSSLCGSQGHLGALVDQRCQPSASGTR